VSGRLMLDLGRGGKGDSEDILGWQIMGIVFFYFYDIY